MSCPTNASNTLGDLSSHNCAVETVDISNHYAAIRVLFAPELWGFLREGVMNVSDQTVHISGDGFGAAFVIDAEIEVCAVAL